MSHDPSAFENQCRPCAAARPSASRWPTRIVAVIAAHGRPRQHFPNSSQVTFIVYQRRWPAEPFYSPNIGFEGGVHIQFIYEHYDDLPDQTVFLTDDTSSHNSKAVHWLGCLRPEANYAPFTLIRLKQKGLYTPGEGHRRAAVVEQCWRNVLDVFGAADSRADCARMLADHKSWGRGGCVLAPRARPRLAYYQGSYFMASAALLRRHRREVYARAHALFAGGDGRCHTGELQWDRLYSNRTDRTLALDAPELTKHTHGSAWEVWAHVLLGGMPAYAPIKFDYCQAFEAQPGCRGSPCKPGAAWLPRPWSAKTKAAHTEPFDYAALWTANSPRYPCCTEPDPAVPCCRQPRRLD